MKYVHFLNKSGIVHVCKMQTVDTSNCSKEETLQPLSQCGSVAEVVTIPAADSASHRTHRMPIAVNQYTHQSAPST